MTNIFNPIAGMSAALFAYFVPHWFYASLFYWMLLIGIFSMYKWVPESASWLLSRGRYDESFETVSKVARVNGEVIPEDLMNRLKVINYLI